jgi:hypothetical protein
MNTESAKPAPNPPLEILPTTAVTSRLDDAAAALEKQIQNERDDRNTERFYWIFGTSLLIDMMALPHLHVAAVIPIFLLQLVFLIGMASRLGIDVVVVLLRRLLDKHLKPSEKDDEE